MPAPRIAPLKAALRTSAFAGFLLLFGCETVGTAVPFEPAPAEAPVWDAMLLAVNEVRAEGAWCGDEWMAPARPLVWDARLATAATKHTRDMAAHNHFDHWGTDGRNTGNRVSETGYDWWQVGENIARHQDSVDEVIEDWKESPGHCRQLLEPRYMEIGAAEENGYWTQVFGVSQGDLVAAVLRPASRPVAQAH